jgi:vacuolar-type H+-ATPase subunit E/Vma4
MALRELVLALERDAQDRITAVRAEATADAQQLKAEAQAALAARRSTDLATRSAELEASTAAALDAARREAGGRTLTARKEALDGILARAGALLAATAPAPGMRAGVARDLEAALQYAGPAGATIRCHPAWAPLLRAALAGRSGVRLESSPEVDAGLIIQCSDGSIEIDATLGNRLSRLWPVIAIELMREAEGQS